VLLFFVFNRQVMPLWTMPVPEVGPSYSESSVLRLLREKVSRMEAEMSQIFAGVAIVNKKSQLAQRAVAYAEKELQQFADSLYCKYPTSLNFLAISRDLKLLLFAFW
jgi:predicted nucleic acid-binding protein